MYSGFIKAPSKLSKRLPLVLSSILALACMISSATLLSSCGADMGTDAELSKNVYMELVDWHISGLWVINCPVAWIRVFNRNHVPIKNAKITYQTFDWEGKPLSSGTYILEGEVPGGMVKNYIEQYLGLVDLHSDKLSVNYIGVERGTGASH